MSEDPARKKWNRKRFDSRYGRAIEAGYSILETEFGISPENIVTPTLKVRDDNNPDLYDNNRQIGVAIGILREETLQKFMREFRVVVHLPFPEKEILFKAPMPTHYRVFIRNKLMLEWTSPLIWGSSLTKGDSKKE